jgi:Na+/melibiose symporter-like transporter
VAVFYVAQLTMFLLMTAGLCLTVVWLTFTALPHTRTRAFGGRASCTNFTSDMASDITLTVLWFVVVTLDSVSLAVRLYKDPRMQAAVFLLVTMFCMHVATAVLSGCVRKQLRSATTAAAAGRLRGVLNEVSLQKL